MMETAIIVPDDVAEEKVKLLQTLGADVEMVRPASIVDQKQVCIPPILPSVLIMSLYTKLLWHISML
jgi:hypothetical protein